MRIVGGRLRSRALVAPRSQSIRPTSDRLRETLFNILLHAYGDPAQMDHVDDIVRLVDYWAAKGENLPRTRDEIIAAIPTSP